MNNNDCDFCGDCKGEHQVRSQTFYPEPKCEIHISPYQGQQHYASLDLGELNELISNLEQIRELVTTKLINESRTRRDGNAQETHTDSKPCPECGGEVPYDSG